MNQKKYKLNKGDIVRHSSGDILMTFIEEYDDGTADTSIKYLCSYLNPVTGIFEQHSFRNFELELIEKYETNTETIKED